MTQIVYDTFTSQGRFYVAGEEVSENVYNRVMEANALLDEFQQVGEGVVRLAAARGLDTKDEIRKFAALLSKRVKP